MLNKDPGPLKIDPHRGIFITKPVQNSTANKHKLFKSYIYITWIDLTTFFMFILYLMLTCFNIQTKKLNIPISIYRITRTCKHLGGIGA